MITPGYASTYRRFYKLVQIQVCLHILFIGPLFAFIIQKTNLLRAIDYECFR